MNRFFTLERLFPVIFTVVIFAVVSIATVVIEISGANPAQNPTPTPDLPRNDNGGYCLEGRLSSEKVEWPIHGPISSYCNWAHPLGIDIDLYNNKASPVHAATAGTVEFAGGDPCCSYGYHIILMSPSGIETVYGHLSKIEVMEDQLVKQGDELGLSGCTGYCTGEHLHFEVIDNGVRVDPLSYLP